jgi:hypothetical protein
LWITELQALLGFENVQVLLYEDLHKNFFWEKLDRFIGVDLSDRHNYLKYYTTNAKKESHTTWKIPDWRDTGHGLNVTYNLIHHIPGLAENGIPSKGLKFLAKSLKRRHLKMLLEVMVKERGTAITLDDELKQEIQSFCRPSNERLSELLNRDVFELGY